MKSLIRKTFYKSVKLSVLVLLLSSFAIQKNHEKTEPLGKGENKFELPKYHSILVAGVAKVFFTQEETKEINMIVSGDPYPKVIRKVTNGVLEIYTEGKARNEVVEIFVSNPTLKSIEVGDRAEFHAVNGISEESLEVIVNDFGMAKLDVLAKSVSIQMNGGDLTISGKTNTQQIIKSKNSDRGTLDNVNLEVVN